MDKKIEKNMLYARSFRENKQAFSLVEMLIGLTVVSLILAAFTPVINKKSSAALLSEEQNQEYLINAMQ